MGADLYDAYNQDNFHIDNLDAAPLALDAVVINSKNANDSFRLSFFAFSGIRLYRKQRIKYNHQIVIVLTKLSSGLW